MNGCTTNISKIGSHHNRRIFVFHHIECLKLSDTHFIIMSKTLKFRSGASTAEDTYI